MDVKTGSGAFMKTVEDSIELAKEMVSIGEHAGKKTVALITDMDIPLGKNIGNSLEVKEAVQTLKGQGPKDLTEVCLHLAGNMMYLAGKGSIEECIRLAKKTLEDGSALCKLVEMVGAQGGDSSVILDTEKFEKAPFSYDVLAKEDGYIHDMNTESCGIASVMLGAGRETKDSEIDYTAGIIIEKKTGDYVKKGERIAVFYASKEELFQDAEERYQSAIQIQPTEPAHIPLIYARVTKDKVERF